MEVNSVWIISNTLKVHSSHAALWIDRWGAFRFPACCGTLWPRVIVSWTENDADLFLRAHSAGCVKLTCRHLYTAVLYKTPPPAVVGVCSVTEWAKRQFKSDYNWRIWSGICCHGILTTWNQNRERSDPSVTSCLIQWALILLSNNTFCQTERTFIPRRLLRPRHGAGSLSPGSLRDGVLLCVGCR